MQAARTKHTNQRPSTDLNIERLKAGDNKEQYKLFKEYYGRLITIPMRYTNSKEEAHEILNTGFMKAFQSIENYRHDGDIGGWLAKIMFTTTIDFVRKRTKYEQRNAFIEFDAAATNQTPIDNLSLQELYGEIQKLPPASRSVFSLYAVEGYKHREIADLLGISENTSKWHLANARAILQKTIKK